MDGEPRDAPAGRELFGSRTWLVVAVAIAGATTITAAGQFLAYTQFPGMSWLDNVGEIAAALAATIAFQYLLAGLAGVAAHRSDPSPLARGVVVTVAVLSAAAALLGVVGIWHFLSFHVHGTGTNSSFGVAFGGYPWRDRLRGVLQGVAAIGLALVTIWIARGALAPARPAHPGGLDDGGPDAIELTPVE